MAEDTQQPAAPAPAPAPEQPKLEAQSLQVGKPEMKYEDGKLKVKASLGVDGDKDGLNSITAELSLEIDALEAVGEIVKNQVPDWLKNLIQKKQG